LTITTVIDLDFTDSFLYELSQINSRQNSSHLPFTSSIELTASSSAKSSMSSAKSSSSSSAKSSPSSSAKSSSSSLAKSLSSSPALTLSSSSFSKLCAFSPCQPLNAKRGSSWLMNFQLPSLLVCLSNVMQSK